MARQPAGGRRRRARTAYLVGLALLVGTGAGGATLFTAPGTAAPSSEANAPQSSPAPVVDHDPTDTEVAEDVIAEALVLPDAAPTTDSLAETVDDTIPAAATGPMQAQLEAEMIEMEAHGWSRSGIPTMSGTRVLEDRSDGPDPQVVVSTCVDWSDVSYVEADGSAVPPNPTPRAQHVFVLTPGEDGPWVVFSQDVAPDPRC